MLTSANCHVCSHPERGRLEMLAVSGVAHVHLAKQFSLSRHSIDRHLIRHLSPERRAQLKCGPVKIRELIERATEEQVPLLDYLSLLRSMLCAQFMSASEANDRNSCALLAGRIIQVLRTQAEITGELVQAPLVGIAINNNSNSGTPPQLIDPVSAYRAMVEGTLRPDPALLTAPRAPTSVTPALEVPP